MTKKGKMELKNCVFIFETTDDLIRFWNYLVDHTDESEIIGNKFTVMQDGWLQKLIKLVLK